MLRPVRPILRELPSRRQKFGVTVLLVTHDIDEAVYLADRVVVLTRLNPRFAELRTLVLSEVRKPRTGAAQIL